MPRFLEMETFIKQKLNRNLRRILTIAAFLMLVQIGIVSVLAQTTKEKESKDKKKTAATKVTPKKHWTMRSRRSASAISEQGLSRNTASSFIWNGRNDNPIEKSIGVSSKVIVEMSVCRGTVKVNGWKRNEIRALLVNGRSLGFSVKEREDEGRKPAWVRILGRDPKKAGVRSSRPRHDCLYGKTVELDVPFNTSLKINSERGTTYIDSVKSVKINQVRGSIYLDNIKNYINAETHKGNVIVRNSAGKISAQTNLGNIIAYKTKTREIGDTFVARTFGGAITLQSIGQRDVKATSSSGAIRYIGSMAKRGGYAFNTTRGLILLVIPVKTSCVIDALFGGEFKSQIPIKDLEKTKDDFVLHLKGRLGSGSCELKFKSPYGRILIESLRKKETHPVRKL